MPSVFSIPDEWTPEAAEAAAAAEQVALTERHWRVIWCWRELSARDLRTPRVEDLDASCGISATEIRKLFPGTASAVLSRIAGVPE